MTHDYQLIDSYRPNQASEGYECVHCGTRELRHSTEQALCPVLGLRTEGTVMTPTPEEARVNAFIETCLGISL